MGEDDDAEWYRQEAGKAPDKELFDKDGTSGLKRRVSFKDTRFKKKRKIGDNSKDRGFRKGPGNGPRKGPRGGSDGARKGPRGGSDGPRKGPRGRRDSQSNGFKGKAKFKISMKKPMNSKRNVKHTKRK